MLIAHDREAHRAATCDEFRDAHVAESGTGELGTAESEVAPAEGAVRVLGLEFGEQPDRVRVRREMFHYKRRVEIVGFARLPAVLNGLGVLRRRGAREAEGCGWNSDGSDRKGGILSVSTRCISSPKQECATMSQIAAILTRSGSIQIELPAPDTEVMTGVPWGAVDAFPTPAYWAFQVLARRLTRTLPKYRLGQTLAEEVGACLLGGHGIPASVGLAAYQRLRERGAFCKSPVSEGQITAWLKEPLRIGERSVRYRFAAQKARYLAAALPIVWSAPLFTIGRELRDWLLALPGVGNKTASWIARNWLDADDVAILDIHIVRVGQAIGLFPRHMTVERHYVELEDRFLRFSAGLEIRASELDATIWQEMASSPRTVRHLLGYLRRLEEYTPSSHPERELVQPALA